MGTFRAAARCDATRVFGQIPNGFWAHANNGRKGKHIINLEQENFGMAQVCCPRRRRRSLVRRLTTDTDEAFVRCVNLRPPGWRIWTMRF